MPKVCVGCGLTTADNGDLIAAVQDGNGWPYAATATCTQASGLPIYCNPETGEIHGPPEKFTRTWEVRTDEFPVGSSAVWSTLAAVDGEYHPLGAAKAINVTNPSPCLPMTLKLKWGVQHAIVRLLGDGDKNIQLEGRLTVTGGATFGPNAFGGHQHWEHDGTLGPNGMFLDTQDSLSDVATITLPAGATCTVTIQSWAAFFKDEQNLSRLGNFVTSCEILGYNE